MGNLIIQFRITFINLIFQFSPGCRRRRRSLTDKVLLLPTSSPSRQYQTVKFTRNAKSTENTWKIWKLLILIKFRKKIFARLIFRLNKTGYTHLWLCLIRHSTRPTRIEKESSNRYGMPWRCPGGRFGTVFEAKILIGLTCDKTWPSKVNKKRVNAKGKGWKVNLGKPFHFSYTIMMSFSPIWTPGSCQDSHRSPTDQWFHLK